MDNKLQLWQQCKLKDVAYLHKDQVNPADLGDIVVHHYSIPAFDEGQVPKQESAENIKSNKFSVPPDAVLLSKLNPRFPRVWLPQIDPTIKSLASTEFLILRPQANTDRRFLKFLCYAPVFRSKLLERLTGTSSSHQRVRPDDVLTIEVGIPPLPEQCAIAAILGTLDDKIELNRQMNQTLEAMVHALFKSWFMDFEPFRDQGMEDSPLGPIPRGWRVGLLRDLCKVAIGGDWGDDEPFEGAVKAVCLRGVDLEYLRRDGWADAPQRWFKKGSLDKRQMTDKDVLIAASGIGPLGRPLWVHPLLSSIFSLPAIYSNFCKRFITPSPKHAVYVERILLNMRENSQIWEYATGTSVPNLDVDGLLKHLIVIPIVDLLARFYDFASYTYLKLYSSESRTLAAVRDTLLPKLLSGEIRVKDAEKFVERVV